MSALPLQYSGWSHTPTMALHTVPAYMNLQLPLQHVPPSHCSPVVTNPSPQVPVLSAEELAPALDETEEETDDDTEEETDDEMLEETEDTEDDPSVHSLMFVSQILEQQLLLDVHASFTAAQELAELLLEEETDEATEEGTLEETEEATEEEMLEETEEATEDDMLEETEEATEEETDERGEEALEATEEETEDATEEEMLEDTEEATEDDTLEETEEATEEETLEETEESTEEEAEEALHIQPNRLSHVIVHSPTPHVPVHVEFSMGQAGTSHAHACDDCDEADEFDDAEATSDEAALEATSVRQAVSQPSPFMRLLSSHSSIQYPPSVQIPYVQSAVTVQACACCSTKLLPQVGMRQSNVQLAPLVPLLPP